MGRNRKIAAATLATVAATTMGLVLVGPVGAVTGATTTLNLGGSASTQGGHQLRGTLLPVSRAVVAHGSSTGSYGFLSFFQEASPGSLDVSVDGGASTSLSQGAFVYGLVPAGAHTVIVTSGGVTKATGTINVGVGENQTSLVYLSNTGADTISGFVNNRTPPGNGNSRTVVRNTAFVGPVDVYINNTLSSAGTGLVNEATNPAPGGSIPTPAGEIDITVKMANTNTVIATASGNLVAGDLLNVFVVGSVATGYSLLTNANPLGAGYRLYAADGGTFNYGSAYFNGSLGGMPINRPIVGATPTAIGLGYWMVASDGGVFSFGDAGFHGSAGNIRLNRPVVGMAGASGDLGYWLVASDGGIFAYGGAQFYGSTGNRVLNQPIVGMASTPDGLGYWLVASDGGIFAFGDANFYGSTGSETLNKPIVGMAPTIDGKGYWLVASDGGIFAFGDATFFGSKGGQPLNQPIVGAFTSPDSLGYWMVAADGGVFSYGNAGFFGSTGNLKLTKPIVAGSNSGVPIPTS